MSPEGGTGDHSGSAESVRPKAVVTIPPPPDLDPFADPMSVAAIDLIFERGYEAVTEAAIVERAGATREDFYRRFADKQECTIKTIEAIQDEFWWTLETAYSRGGDWQSGLRCAAWAAADFIDAHPAVVQVVVVDLLRARNEMLRVLREKTLMFCAAFIDRGRSAAPDPDAITEGAGLVAMGSMAQLMTHRFNKGEPLAPHEMVRQMMYMVVRSYLGEEPAKVELDAPRPAGSFVERPR